MIEYEIPNGIIAAAHATALAMNLTNHSENFTDDDGASGLLAEWAFQQYRPQARHDNTPDYDFFINDYRIDVKSKRIASTPKPHHGHNIHSRQKNKACDLYVFAAVKRDYSRVWLMGWASKKEFYSGMAKERFFGEEEVNDDGSVFKFHCHCWNVKYHQLRGLT